ncbi:nicotinate-nucleotide adenylyltransferase [uncultured Ilyobacter sp.]|uniref:nicotinate-nucleotide adenylyltransferase n=1 Tax=uncultured Ilyobacter sp. TaxID=544433 RepID=UPI0029C08E4C|nr:nicotinate-nucleotide adenylyltransferase [uncultured Ilyobacter sp.]
MEKIGIYGGSFNPVHIGHVEIMKYVLKEMKLDRLIVIPVGFPSHKDSLLLTGEKRIELLEAACKDIEKVTISDIEVQNKGVSYTYDTLLNLKKKYKDAIFYEIIGEDSADYLQEWKDYEKMVEECKFVVLKRNGYAYRAEHNNIIVLESPLYRYSSTEVRERLKKGLDISDMVPKKVHEIIIKEKLYR